MSDVPSLPLIAQVNTGDTAWMLMATALVILMTIGLGVFYAGLVRSKNTLNTFMMCVAALGVAGISWALVGYSLAFGDGGGFIGNFDYAFLSGVGFEPLEGQTIPHLVFFAFQAQLLHHHAGARLGRGRGADAASGPSSSSRSCGRCSSIR